MRFSDKERTWLQEALEFIGQVMARYEDKPEERTRLQQALEFIGQVKARYKDKPEVYQSVLRRWGDYQRKLWV